MLALPVPTANTATEDKASFNQPPPSHHVKCTYQSQHITVTATTASQQTTQTSGQAVAAVA
jgi:hypothetical protein